MEVKKGEKRSVRTYKTTDEIYHAARRRAWQQKSTLATKIEDFLKKYIKS